VVDEFGAAAANGAIDHRTVAGVERVDMLAETAAPRLLNRDPLADAFDHTPAGGNRLQREDTSIVDFRPPGFQPKARLGLIDSGNPVWSRRKHNLPDERG